MHSIFCGGINIKFFLGCENQEILKIEIHIFYFLYRLIFITKMPIIIWVTNKSTEILCAKVPIP